MLTDLSEELKELTEGFVELVREVDRLRRANAEFNDCFVGFLNEAIIVCATVDLCVATLILIIENG